MTRSLSLCGRTHFILGKKGVPRAYAVLRQVAREQVQVVSQARSNGPHRTSWLEMSAAALGAYADPSVIRKHAGSS
jgi:hypothetical protein